MKRTTCIALLVGLTTVIPIGCNKNDKPKTVIQGSVTNEAGRAMPDVSVLLDGTRYSAKTNKDGKFSISGFPPGIYTAVAVYHGYLTATHYNIEVTKESKRAESRLVLKRDPDYVPDQLKIVNIRPVPDSVLSPGKDVLISFQVEYTLSSAGYATIAVSYQDDRAQSMIPMPAQVTITKEKGRISFGHRIRVPARMNGKINVIAAMFSSDDAESKVADMVTYYVRPFEDQVKIAGIGLTSGSVWGTGKDIAITATIYYLLKSYEKATIRFQIRGDLKNDRFEVVLQEETKQINRAGGESGTFAIQPRFSIPTNVTAIRARVDLIPEGMTEPLVIHWSRRYATEVAFGSESVDER